MRQVLGVKGHKFPTATIYFKAAVLQLRLRLRLFVMIHVACIDHC